MPSSLVSSCRSTDALGDAFSALGIAKDCVSPLANDVDMEFLRQRVIVVLMEQLSSSLGPLAVATQLRQLVNCGIVTRDVILENSPGAFLNDDIITETKLPSNESERVSTGYSRFDQDFDKLELMGRGAFGEVWRCRHRLDDCEYAVKAVHFQANSGDKNYMKLAAREARTLAGLAPHPGILRYHTSWVEVNEVSKENPLMGLPKKVETLKDFEADSPTSTCPISDCGSDAGVTFRDESDLSHQAALVVPNALVTRCNGKNDRKDRKTSNVTWATLYIQTELCEKDTLAQWIYERNEALTSAAITSEERELWAKRSYEIFNECVGGVRHMHAFGCVHRDIKPLNILFKSDGRVQLGDFGLAKIVGNRDVESVGKPASTLSLATSNALSLHTRGMGTPSYASPEQLSGGEYGVEADVFSLGVVLAELLYPLKTQMERAAVLEQLHNRRRLPAWLSSTFPLAARLALEMTQPEAKKRPTLDQIAKVLPKVMREMQQHFSTNIAAVDELYPAKVGHSLKFLPEPSRTTLGCQSALQVMVNEGPFTTREKPLQFQISDRDGMQFDSAKSSPSIKKDFGEFTSYPQPKEMRLSTTRGTNSKPMQVLSLPLLISVLLSGLLGGTPDMAAMTQQSMVMTLEPTQVDGVDETLMFDVLPDLQGYRGTLDLEEAYDIFELDLRIGVSADKTPAPEHGRTDLKLPRSWCTSEDPRQDIRSPQCPGSRLKHNNGINDIISNVFGVRWRVRPTVSLILKVFE
jgi:serine/threonine protein kinase|mmetsp:Transcript_38927/g.61575  ORF Transcript_38927/g.61575 Transcript_38927/m.61575 type:complete len:750 (-) Transcript_38927:121-2370(-)